MSNGGSDAGQELIAAARRAVALTWHELTEASVAYTTTTAGGGIADVHEIERAEGRLRTAAVAYGKAVDQGHAAAASHRHPPVTRRRGVRP